jgi:hypothetical protein
MAGPADGGADSRVPVCGRVLASNAVVVHGFCERSVGPTGTSTADGRRVALVSVGRHRLSIHAGESRCEARWTASGAAYRIAAPMTLAAFMDVLLSLLWE